jgi:pyruvate kinase
VAGTTYGSTVRLVTGFRSSRPVIGLTHVIQAQQQLNLSWEVLPILVEPYSDTDQMFALAKSQVLEKEIVRHSESLIITAGVPLATPGTTNLLKVIELEHIGDETVPSA